MQIHGTLLSIRVYRGTWARGTLRTDEGDTLIVIGSALGRLKKGDSYLFDGVMTDHETYGQQMDVQSVSTDDMSGMSSKTSKTAKTIKTIKTGITKRRAPRASKTYGAKMTGTRTARPRRRSAPAYVSDAMQANDDPQALRRMRMEESAYMFGSRFISAPAEEDVRIAAIYAHLCETLAWAGTPEFTMEVASRIGSAEAMPQSPRPTRSMSSDPVPATRSRATASKPRATAKSSASRKATSFMVANDACNTSNSRNTRWDESDIEIFLHHEAAHHIACDLMMSSKQLSTEKYADEVFAVLQGHARTGMPAHDPIVSRAAADSATQALRKH
jgi:hypothetical protein